MSAKADALNFARAQERSAFEVRELRRELYDTQRRLHRAEALRETLFGLTKPALDVPRWIVSKAPAKESEHIPVLMASDFHWGEVISSARLGGLNSYDIKTAEMRYRRLIERTIDIAFSHLPQNRYPGIVLLRLGDMISGEIHADFRETNELHSVPAVRSLVASETWGIGELARAFGHVHVVSVPGNHTRTTLKPQSKRGDDNYDSLAAWWLEATFAKDKRVTFHTPESGEAVVRLYGRRYLATHGDRIGARGGEGFLGPVARITLGMKKLHDRQGKLGMPISGVFLGHFHYALDLELGWSNGSLPGYSEYARDGCLVPQPPVQWLLFFHRKYGITSSWKVRTAEAPTLKPEQIIRPFEVEK